MMERRLGWMVVAATLMPAPAAPASAAPAGQMTFAVHVALAPTWFDPAETAGIVTPFMVLYAMHDALVKPMPGNAWTPSLAESWTATKDGLSYDFVLRKGVKFHDGTPVTAGDVKFSFERYRGAAAKELKDRVARVDVDGPHVRFRLKKPWPDFMTFYASPATGAAWIVPRTYVEKVGEDGFKKAPVGAGPYKFVSFRPGVELTLEANEHYWRKTPSVKTLVFRVIPDESTRLAALERNEVDVAYSITGPLAEELARTPTLAVVASHFTFTVWMDFVDQWYAYAPKKAKQLLAEAGYPNGFDAGEMTAEMVYGSAIGEPAVNDLQTAGIRIKLRPLERAAFYKEYGDKKLRHVVFAGSGSAGNTATRLETYAVSGGRYVYGSYPEIDGLFTEQANETNPRVRTQLLHKIQQLIHERAMFAPLLEPALLNGVGPRVAVHGLDVVPNYPYAGPYEDLKLEGK